MNKVIIIGALFALAICLAGCVSTITEFDKDGNVTRVTKTPASKDIIETLALQNKDKTFIVFREAYVVGLQVTPASTTTDSLLSLECVYAHKNTGLASISKEQQNMDKIADLIKAMKSTDAVSVSSSGVSSGSAASDSK